MTAIIPRIFVPLLLPLCLAGGLVFAAEEASPGPEWEKEFQNPPNLYRPLQIIHGFDNLVAARYPGHTLEKEFLSELLQKAGQGGSSSQPDLKDALREALRDLAGSGLGGVVCNVAFSDYLHDENQLKFFALALEICRELGLRVWIYDEEGYPSAAAGGLVLEKNPAFEAQELILTPGEDKPYTIRPSYEGTHACNNFYMARRYPNLLDPEAMRTFVEVTHDAYARVCQAYFGNLVEAFFTDEPSLMACNLGMLPESVRKNVRIMDPLDPQVKRLPAVPWVNGLPDLFKKKYGYDLLPKVASLFSGDSPADKTTRRDFWALTADLVEQRFFGLLEEWCQRHGVASSGHILWEESLLYHPALNGNPLRNLQRMQIPGIDVLSSNPSQAFGGYAITTALAASAARLNGTRRVMSETSDHSEQMNKRSASLDEMRATAAWQFAQGVTDLTLYYGRNRPGDEYKQYADFVGRLGALLTPARRAARVALYYPVTDLWAEYKPEAEPLSLDRQSETMQKIVRAFPEICAQLTRAGIAFVLVDPNHVAQASIQGRQLKIQNGVFDALLIPAVGEIPADARTVMERFKNAGGAVVDTTGGGWLEALKPYPAAEVKTETPGGLWARFERGGEAILLFVNTAASDWNGMVSLPAGKVIRRWNFAAGSVQEVPAESLATGALKVTLKPFESLALSWSE
ncbi:MAG: hypothetical protein ACE15F_22255 [bacterium]